MKNAWSTEDCTTAAIILAAEGAGWGGRKRAVAAIAAKLKRTPAAVNQRLQERGITFMAAVKPTSNLAPTGQLHDAGRPTVVPSNLFADRDARKAAANLRDFAATWQGDPPVGFSELDHKRAAQGQAT